MGKAHYLFLILVSCLTIVRIMGFCDYGVSGVVNSFFLNGGENTRWPPFVEG